jgi:hypothetical protein
LYKKIAFIEVALPTYDDLLAVLAPAASSSRFSSKHVIATNSTGACSVCDF